MEKVRVILLLMMSIICFGKEIDYKDVEGRALSFEKNNEIRIQEVYKLDGSETEIFIRNFPKEIDRTSLIYDDSKVEESIFLFEESEMSLIGRKAYYKSEEYEIMSMDPIMLKRKTDGMLLLNPENQLEIEPLNISKGNTLRLKIKVGTKEVSIDYSYLGLTWKEINTVDIGERTIKNEAVISNATNQNFEKVVIPKVTERIDLVKNTEKKVTISESRLESNIEYYYESSTRAINPKLRLDLKNEDASKEEEVIVIEGSKYVGKEINNSFKDGVLSEIEEKRITIEETEEEIEFDVDFRKLNKKLVIKNHKNTPIKVNIIYDELPEKWYEIKSVEEYSLTDKGIKFELDVSENSIKLLEFSYIFKIK